MADVRVHGLTSKTAIAKYARETVGGLGNPSKMPGFAYGIPPEHCRTGSKLRELDGTPCSDCYACKGRYTTTEKDGTPGSVARAQSRRFDSLSNLTEWRDNFVRILSSLTPITSPELRYFRWHDAGDIQSAEHLQAIVDIARATPEWSYWVPTQEHREVRQYLNAGGTFPSNLCVRESSPKLGAMINASTGSSSYVEPDKAKFSANPAACPAYRNGGECGECRRCWNPSVPVVVYPAH
jgi:hypothetical protein